MRLVRSGILVLLLLSAAPERALAQPGDVMRVHFIDVGQGSATLIELPCAAVLIDTGGEQEPDDQIKTTREYDSTPALMAYLEGFFAKRPDLMRRLDLLILTHPHPDHTRGVAAVLDAFAPRNVVYDDSWTGAGVEGQNAARLYALDSPGVGRWPVREEAIDKTTGQTNPTIDPIGACATTDPRITILWGTARYDPSWSIDEIGNENNDSVVVRVDYGEASLLVTGDLEMKKDPAPDGKKGGIERLVAAYAGGSLLDADVYVVGHHGSENGTTDALLDAITPEIAVMSTGPACKHKGSFNAWQFGHPRKRIVDKLDTKVSGTRATPANVKVFTAPRQAQPRQVTKAIYSTGWDGSVVLSATPDGTWRLDSTPTSPACLAG